MFELYVRLREKRQRTATCESLCLVACSALVVGGCGHQQTYWAPTSPMFSVPHFRELGPESLKVSGMDLQLCGLQVWCWLVSTVLWLMVVEQQLDLSSVTTRLRGGSCVVLSGLVEVLPVVVCPGGGTILVVVPMWYLVNYTAKTTLLELLTLHRYGAARSWTTVVKRPPRSHLRGVGVSKAVKVLTVCRLRETTVIIKRQTSTGVQAKVETANTSHVNWFATRETDSDN
ncbi:hypothetical protein Taro_053519 [Colocasia esculenta]|uniref:Uncharacterized protein n=1 Tax=Colocasia esculenta TaxID=4460 RepID=A0A843XL82_COLES|nr:hypothetical protein [Colocasia esculenta]